MRVLIVVLSLFFLGACAHHGPRAKCSKKSHHKMWEKMDADKDGKVSKDEFIKEKGNWFAEMDADKDGFLTKEEKMEFMKKKHKGKKGCKGCK